MPKSILYVQYANPAAYPPLEHSSRMLAEAGWRVTLFGVASRGTETFWLPTHAGIDFRLWSYQPPGWTQKFHYLAFTISALLKAVSRRADWIYVSDPLACPAGWCLSILGWRVVYHEHDSPVSESVGEHSCSVFQRWILKARIALARRAAFCVLPNEGRIERFKAATGTARPVLCVMNCPRREETQLVAAEPREMILHYHGNIGPELVPVTVVRALALVPEIKLRIIGYFTAGTEYYGDELRRVAAEVNVVDRLEILPPMSRGPLFKEARRASIGLVLMPPGSNNVNFQSMVGASNKAFDYLACGLPLLVSELPDWTSTFVTGGLGRSCNPADANSIAAALRWFVMHANETQEMGARGRGRILGDWNYERQFASAFERLNAQTKSGG